MFRRPAVIALSTMAMLAGAAAPASAATVTFGADLSLPANNTPGTTCKDGTWWNTLLLGLPLLGNIVPAQSQGSCQFSSGGLNASGLFGLAAPATGTATAARVKVGNITGPMRINVIRTLFQQTGDAAHPISSTPYLEAYGPTFTPQANAITTVPLNIAMRAQATPDINDTTTVAGTDWLALEVLSNTVPVPLALSSGAAAFFFAAFPGPTAGSVPAPSPTTLPNYGNTGLQVLMSADLVTADKPTPTPAPATGGGGGGSTPTAGTPTGPTIGLGKQTANLAGGKARLNLICQVTDCSGVVTLQPAGNAARSSKATTYGSAKFSGQAGKTFRVGVKLNAKGRGLLRSKKTAKVQAVVTLNGVATPTTLPVTLKR